MPAEFYSISWQVRETRRMPLLASYLLIFTVVTSFVTSQPVTNLSARNKLTPVPSHPTNDENTTDVTTTISYTQQQQHTFTSSEKAASPSEVAGELNQFRGTKQLGNYQEERLIMIGTRSSSPESVNISNNNDDVLHSRRKNKDTLPPSSSSMGKIRNEIGGGGGGSREMALDKAKVMVTDDVKKSSQNVNPSSFFSQNDPSEEKDAATSSLFDEDLDNDDTDRDEDFKQEADEGASTIISSESSSQPGDNKRKVNITARNVTARESQGMTSSTPDMTVLATHAPNENGNVVNNHANLLLQQGQQHSIDRGDTDKDRESHTGNNTSNNVTSTSGISPLENGDDDDVDSSKGNLESSLLVTEMDKPFSSFPIMQSFSSSLSSVDANKKERDDKREGDIEKGELHHHHQSDSSDYYYNPASPPPSLSSPWNPPPPPSSPLLMNKWIKTLVKLSQCRANCLDQAWAAEYHSADDVDFVAHALSTSSTGEEKGRIPLQEGDYDEEKTGGAMRASQLPPSNWKDRVENSKMSVVAYLEKKNPPRPILPPGTTTPGRTIKATTTKSMKYYELSTCQESCRNKFPIPKRSNFVGAGGTVVGANNNNIITTRNNKEELLTEGNKRSRSSNGNGNNRSGNNGRRNNNIQRKQTPVEMEKADRKSNNNHHQQHHYMPSQKDLVLEHAEQTQLLSSNLQQEEQQQPSNEQQQQLPDGQNEVGGERKGNGSDSLMKLFAIEQVQQAPEKDTGSASNFKTFPTEPWLKVRQVFGEKKKDGIPLRFLQLSWPKPSSWSTSASANNNNGPEGASAQVKDRKGIDADDDDDDDKDEKNEKQESRHRAEQGIQPITVYSIILEESWEQERSDGTRDTYARWWKLIDQTVVRTSTQISLPGRIVPTEQKKRGEPSEPVTAGAFAQKKEIIKGKGWKKNSQRVMMPPSPFSLAGGDSPSKVTLRVLAVTSKGGLEKVYSAELNNSYYHSDEHNHQHDHDHPNQRLEQVYRENHEGISSGTGNGITSDSHNTSITNFSNETTGNQLLADWDKKKEKGKVRKKVEKSKSSGINSHADSDGNNENSNQILAFPSGNSEKRTEDDGKVKKLLSEEQQRENENKGGNEANSLTSHGGATTTNTNANFSQDKIGPLLSPDGNAPHWGLHTISMVYQKFLVVTQVTWDFPGDMEEEENGKMIISSQDVSTQGNDGDKEPLRKTGNNKSTAGNNITFTKATLKGKSKISLYSQEETSGERKMEYASEKRKGCGVTPSSSGKGAERKLNFLLSWEIFGGGLRGNLVTDTCSASISLWPDTVYIIQVGLITPDSSLESKKEASESTGDSPNYLPLPSTPHPSFSTPSIQNEGSLTMRKTHSDVDRDTDKDEISSWKRKLERSSDRSLSFPSSPLQGEILLKSSTISSGAVGSIENVPRNSELPVEEGKDVASSFDPLILPESITFPFDGEPKVTIKSERILVNTTRASGGAATNTNGDSQDKTSQGNSQSNNFLKDDPENVLGKKDWSKKQTGKNSDAFVFPSRIVVTAGSSTTSTDQAYVSPITITKNDDGQNDHFFGVNDQAEGAAGDEDEETSSVWDDEDETTDQDESLFARSHSHHHHSHHQLNRQSSGSSKDSSALPAISLASSIVAEAQIQPEEKPDEYNKDAKVHNGKERSLSLLESASSSSHPTTTTKSNGINGGRYPNFFPVNSFYQSLYALSQNALPLSSRYPSVITINGYNSKNGNITGDTLAPLLLSELSGHPNHNSSGYFYSSSSNGDDGSGSVIRGKLYTLFVILVISFVIFLFIVAVVGFCVLTSSIKENYKYFVPKKVRVWTTVGQLLKGHTSPSATAAGEGSRCKDSAEGSFYPRRLHEEPDYEFDDNDDFDPDEDEEDATSAADTDEEEDCCDCSSDHDNDERNTFTLNERSTDDTTNLISIEEEEEITVTVSSQDDDGGGGCSGESGGGNGNCDNNNPYYHSKPGGRRMLSSSSVGAKASVSAAITSLKENFHLPHHHPHNNSGSHQQKKKSDVRIDVSTNSRKGPSHQRQQGFY